MGNYSITDYLVEIDRDENAFDRLFPFIYDQIKTLAQSHLRKEQGSITLQPTELVHELYLRLIDQSRITVNSKRHFYGIASNCLRQILVDHARKKKAKKRGGDAYDITLIPEEIAIDEHEEHVLAIDELLQELYALDERAAQIVEMKFFGGMRTAQISEVLDVSEKTVKRDWSKARLWIYTKLQKQIDE